MALGAAQLFLLFSVDFYLSRKQCKQMVVFLFEDAYIKTVISLGKPVGNTSFQPTSWFAISGVVSMEFLCIMYQHDCK